MGARLIALTAALLGFAAPAGALAAPAGPPIKVIHYHGYRLLVPANWPVYSLDKAPATCVRFDHHAVYLGRPGTDERCPTAATGRTEAILIEPLSGKGTALARPLLRGASQAAADLGSGSVGRLVDRVHGVVVTATWNGNPSAIARALGVRSVAGLAAAARVRPAPWHAAGSGSGPGSDSGSDSGSSSYDVRAAGAAATPGEVFTGFAFDACSTPSSAKMAAWLGSHYRGVGVYIGGANMACSQTNLTASWVAQQSARGWHMIPIYVGLQAPSNSCGCAPITPAAAAGEGHAAALDAVAQAQAIDLGPGNPIYYDMEAYNRNHRNTAAVLAFLQAWTRGLHAAGYQSGIYSSEYSGVEDLAARVGTGYAEPDDIWVANWDGEATTLDPNLPSSDWGANQRIHQFAGAHDERHGRATINIDGDYVDAATAAAGSATVPSVVPAAVPARPPAPASASGHPPAHPHPHGPAHPHAWPARRHAHRPWLRRHHGLRRA